MLVDGNLKALVIDGQPDQEDILKAWKVIQEEYIEAIGEKELMMERALYIEIITLEANFFLARLAIEQMQLSYHPGFARHLNAILKTNFQFDPNDPEKYYALLKNCYNRTGGIKIDLDLKKIQYAAIEEKYKEKGESQPYTREYFQTMLITLSDFVQYQLHDTITVFEYCDRIRRLQKYNEQVKAQQYVRSAH